MLAGMSKEEKKLYNLTAAADYVYLNQVDKFDENESIESIVKIFVVISVGRNDLL